MTDKRETNRKIREGEVISTKMNKTIVVRVDRLVQHKRYGKTMRLSKNVHVHAEEGSCKIGDIIKIMETRPLSKTKRWRYIGTVREAVQV